MLRGEHGPHPDRNGKTRGTQQKRNVIFAKSRDAVCGMAGEARAVEGEGGPGGVGKTLGSGVVPDMENTGAGGVEDGRRVREIRNARGRDAEIEGDGGEWFPGQLNIW